MSSEKNSKNKGIESKQDEVIKKELIKKGILAHLNGDVIKAELIYKDILDSGVFDASTLSNYGVICMATRRVDKAKSLFKLAIKKFPEKAEAYNNLGSIYKTENNLKEALVCFNKAISLKENYIDAHYNLGSLYLAQNNIKKAYIHTQKTIDLEQNNAKAYVNMGKIKRLKGDLDKANSYLMKAIEIDKNLSIAYLNLGGVLREQNKIEEAEIATKEAIKLNSNSDGHYNLSGILIEQGKLKKAEEHLYKSIKIERNRTDAYFLLSNLIDIKKDDKLVKELFKIKPKDLNTSKKINYYFTLANYYHKKENYTEASKNLEKANNLKLKNKPSEAKQVIQSATACMVLTQKLKPKIFNIENKTLKIFIVGMPRCGSTLLESILSMNEDVYDLGETTIFKESVDEWVKELKINKHSNLSNVYKKKTAKIIGNRKLITTDKQLYNYVYAGLIAHKIEGAKIIHCTRNPFDNILSIYKANFTKGHRYSSSLNDCSEVFLHHENIMKEYKSIYGSEIYEINYEKLVTDSETEIRKLIDWLGFEWKESYLSPNLSTRNIRTASFIQARSSINKRSLNGWKNYEDMLKPVIEKFKAKNE